MIFTLSVASKSFSFRDSPHYENKSSIKQVTTQTKTLNRKANSRNYLMGSEWFARSTILIHVHAIHTIYGISSGRPLHFPSTCLIREQKVEANAIRLEKGTFSRTCTALSFVARKSAYMLLANSIVKEFVKKNLMGNKLFQIHSNSALTTYC